MKIPSGSHKLGPESAALTVKTARTGAAAKAGHDLVIDVTTWGATLDVGEDSAPTAITLEVDATSLRVRDGTGGMKALTDDDKLSIKKTIDDEVLHREQIKFHSTQVQSAGDGTRIRVEGQLELAGKTHPIAFDLATGRDGRLTGSATVRQTNWGIKPYSALFGALRVADEVEVVFDAGLPSG